MQSCKLLSERNMTQSQFPFDEEARLKALDELALLDTLPEPVFDEIVQRAAKACDTPIALLSLVDSRRQWYKARLGFALPELPRTIGFDGRTLLQSEPLVVPNAQEDSLYAKDPLVQSELNIRFYAGIPLKTVEGLPLGALSVMDYRPRELSTEQMNALLAEATLAMEQLNKRHETLLAKTKQLAAAAADEERFVKPKRDKSEARAILPDVMLRFSAELRYIYVSPYAVETLGMKPDNLLGSVVGEERYAAPFAALLKPSLEKALQNRRVEEVRFYAPTPSGERLFQTLVMPEVSRGEVTNILAIIRETEEEETPEPVIVEVPVEVRVEVPAPAPKPNLRALLGLAITEADNAATMLQNSAEVLADYAEASSLRIWIRSVALGRLTLEASSGSLALAMPGQVGELFLSLPSTVSSLSDVANAALEADSAGTATFKLSCREVFPLTAGNALLGVVVSFNSKPMPEEVRNEIRESMGVVSVNLRRSQDNSELAQQSTFMARELMDIKLALQQESENSASLAHDMRTPLNSVLGFTNLLLGTELNSTQRELSEMTRTSAQALLDIVRGTLNQSKRASGQPQLENVAFDLRSLIEEVCEILAPNAQKKGLEIVVHCAPTLPSKLLGDRNKIRQILMNLGDNAIKFTSNGYILMDINHESISNDRVSIKIEVEDTGIGIAPEKIEHIFDRYVQADSDSDNPDKGSGLGLSISREFATQMRGTLAVKSQLGDGAIFRLSLTLPVEPDAIPVSRREPGLEKLRVLIVDGSRLQQYALQEQIFAWGAEALLCPNAQEMLEALEFGKNKGRPFHMVLLDEKMTGYNYQTLSRTILNDPALKETKLELIAAVGNRQAQNLQAEGIAGYLSKPVRSTPLKEALLAEAKKLTPTAELAKVVETPALPEQTPVSPAVEQAVIEPVEALPPIAIQEPLSIEKPTESEFVAPVVKAEEPALASQIAPSSETELVAECKSGSELVSEPVVDSHSSLESSQLAQERAEPSIVQESDRSTPQETELTASLETETVALAEKTPENVQEEAKVDNVALEAEPTAAKLREPDQEPTQAVETTDQPTEELPVRELLADALGKQEETPDISAASVVSQSGTAFASPPPALLDMLNSLDSIPLPLIQQSSMSAVEEKITPTEQPSDPTEDENKRLEDESKDPIPVNLEVEDTRLKALAVDDDAVNLKLHLLMLEGMHYVVDTAASGLEALDLFDTRVYDLILIDCRLNGIDGYQTASMMRRREGIEQRTRIIAVTGDTTPSVKEKCFEAGMDACLIKPVSAEEIEACIESILKREIASVEEEKSTPLQKAEPVIQPTPAPRPAVKEGIPFNLASIPGLSGVAAASKDVATETIQKSDILALRIAADKKNAEIEDAIEMNSIMDRKALLQRVAGSPEVLQSLSNLCKVECARQVNDMRTSIGEGDRSTFLRATHKLRGMLLSLNATAAVEAVRKLELTANQGRPADAKTQMTVLEGELDRLQRAMESILASMS